MLETRDSPLPVDSKRKLHSAAAGVAPDKMACSKHASNEPQKQMTRRLGDLAAEWLARISLPLSL